MKTFRILLLLSCPLIDPILLTAQTTSTAQTDEGQRQIGDVPQGPGAQAAQGPQRPQYMDLRFDEDWSHIREVPGPRDFWDPIKYIVIDESRGWYMTLGGEIRQRWDNWHNANFGYSPAEWLNGNLQRYMFNADMHFGRHLRFFTQTQSALEYGKKGGSWYTDEDRFEIHQAFLEYRSSDDPTHYTRLRVGRQEIALGTDRSEERRVGKEGRSRRLADHS